MRYSINNYVEAFSQAVEGASSDTAVKGLVKLLRKTGDIRNANKIFEAIHKKLVNSKGGRWVNIETARESASTKELMHKFSAKDHVEVKINPELVAGARVTINGEEELDNSLSYKLNKMFK